MNETIARRQQAEREERVNKVINVAKKLFYKNGYQRTTVRDIALKAHFSTGVIYFYFDGKGDIYGRLLEQGYQIYMDMQREAACAEGTVIEKLKAVAYAYVNFYLNYPEYHDVISNQAFRHIGLPAEIVKKHDNLSTQSFLIPAALMEEAIQQGLIIDYKGGGIALILLAWAFIIGLITVHRRGDLDKYGVDFAKSVDFHFDIFMKGILRQESARSSTKSIRQPVR